MKSLRERKEKLDKRQDKAKILYEWVKSGQINLREFRELSLELNRQEYPNAR